MSNAARITAVAVFLLLAAWTSSAQTAPCPAGVASDKLLCLLPNTFENGLLLKGVPQHQGHFGAESFLSSSLKPLNADIGSQSVLLPLASPSSGLTFTWDSSAKVFLPSTDSLGPVLGERAETIGKYHVFVGFSYQYFDFNRLDGLDLRKSLPAVFTHQDDSADVTGRTCSVSPPDTPSNTGPCGFVRDVIRTSSRFDLKIHQFTSFFTFGITDRIDLSMAVPIKEVLLGASSNALVVNNSLSFLHEFCSGQNCSNPFQNSFSNAHSASGVGDITFRFKATTWKGEQSAFAVGVDVRAPTGDQLNFLGAGAAGIRPFFNWSRRSRASVHVLAGYEINGSSVIAGNVLTGEKERLPSQFTYSGGTDIWITKRLTAAVDLIGQQVFQAQQMKIVKTPELGACIDVYCGECPSPPGTCTPNNPPSSIAFKAPISDANLSAATRSYNITDLSVGAKLNPIAGLVVTINTQIRLNDSGLRAKPVPLVGLAYTFR